VKETVRRRRQFIREHHPDRGGDAGAFIAGMRAFDNCRHVVSVRCCGAGGIFRALRIRRMVDALTRWPSLSSSPWILLYPQPLFSVASLYRFKTNRVASDLAP
jgi:hypothetical protein